MMLGYDAGLYISGQTDARTYIQLTTIVTAMSSSSQAGSTKSIRGFNKENMTDQLEYGVDFQRLKIKNNAEMQKEAAVIIKKRRAEENDFAFIQDIVMKSQCAEFN